MLIIWRIYWNFDNNTASLTWKNENSMFCDALWKLNLGVLWSKIKVGIHDAEIDFSRVSPTLWTKIWGLIQCFVESMEYPRRLSASTVSHPLMMPKSYLGVHPYQFSLKSAKLSISLVIAVILCNKSWILLCILTLTFVLLKKNDNRKWYNCTYNCQIDNCNFWQL